MWQRSVNGSGGGSPNNPTLVETGVIGQGQIKSVTIDASKDYIICGNSNYTYSGNLMDVYSFTNGSLTQIQNGATAFVCSYSGNTISKQNGAGINVGLSYAVVQLN